MTDPGGIVTLGAICELIFPKSRIEFGVLVETLCIIEVTTETVVCVNAPVTLKEEIGLEEYPVSPLIITELVPTFSQLPLERRLTLAGMFHPLSSPKYLVDPILISLTKGE